MDKRYRVEPSLQGAASLSDFVDRVYAEVPAERPGHPTCYEGEWVCPHAPCPVRSVRLRVKAFFHEHLPRLRCPLCLRQMDFCSWLDVIVLQEVPSVPAAREPPTRPASRPRKRRRVAPAVDESGPR